MSTIKLYNEDCFDLLSRIEDNSIDLVLIDPPYLISRNTNFQSGKLKGTNVDRFRLSMNFGEWDSKNYGLESIILEMYRVLKPHGTLICFYDVWKIGELKSYYEQARFKQLRVIEWIKSNPVPINSRINYLTNTREIAITGVKTNKPTFNSEYDNGIYIYPIYHNKDRFHPTQKPISLMENLILKHSNASELVLDCFAGSATTAVAAYNTHRNFIGCEIDETYFNKSIQRLKRECKGCKNFGN